MIAHLIRPSIATTVFSAGELPETIHGSVLQEIMIPRVASWSMSPTLQKGDRLELEQTDALQAGDVIVYRQARLLVCHRIQRIEGTQLYLKGDASDGPPEQINALDVVGRVTALLRDGRRLPIAPRHHTLNQSATHPTWNRYATRSQERGRALALQLIEFVVALPLLGLILRHLLGRVVTIEMLEQAPLQALTGYVKQHHFRLYRTDQFKKYLSGTKTDLSRIALVIRAGPLHLGSCSVDPWHLKIRPLAASLGLESPLQSIGSLLKTRGPL